MTIEKFEYVVGCINEGKEMGLIISRVYEYTHAISHKTLYALFIEGLPDDIYESPMVENPVLIYCNSKFQGKYEYANAILQLLS